MLKLREALHSAIRRMFCRRGLVVTGSELIDCKVTTIPEGVVGLIVVSDCGANVNGHAMGAGEACLLRTSDPAILEQSGVDSCCIIVHLDDPPSEAAVVGRVQTWKNNST